jgi:outer membrane protein OmpA-like peptidoglycan-associated protein
MKRSLLLIIILIITIECALAQGENLVKNGSFENGNDINSDFAQGWEWGYYTITDQVVSKFGKTFIDPAGSTGRFLIVDVNNSKKQRLWYDSITIKPNTTYSFTCIVANIFAPQDNNNMYAPREYTPVLQLNVNGKRVSRALIIYSNMNDERKTEWKTLSGKFTSGPDQIRIEISIVDKEWGRWGNDVAIDNISFVEIETQIVAVVKDKKKKEIAESETPVAVLPEPQPEPKPVEPVKEPEPIKEPEKVILPDPVVKKDTGTAPTLITGKVVKEEKPVIVAKADPVKPVIEKKIVTPPVKKEAEKKPIPVPVMKKEPENKPIAPPPVKKKPISPPPVIKEVEKKPEPVIVKIEPAQKEKKKETVKKVEVVPEPVAKPVETPVKKDSVFATAGVAFKKNMNKEMIHVGQKLELSHIYFERGKSALLNTSMPELNDLVSFMNKYPTVRIRLEGHTDNQGNPVANKELSENRVKETKKYLVEHGIADDRIEWVGYGGARALNSNRVEALRKLNRRVEVVIIDK